MTQPTHHLQSLVKARLQHYLDKDDFSPGDARELQVFTNALVPMFDACVSPMKAAEGHVLGNGIGHVGTWVEPRGNAEGVSSQFLREILPIIQDMAGLYKGIIQEKAKKVGLLPEEKELPELPTIAGAVEEILNKEEATT